MALCYMANFPTFVAGMRKILQGSGLLFHSESKLSSLYLGHEHRARHLMLAIHLLDAERLPLLRMHADA